MAVSIGFTAGQYMYMQLSNNKNLNSSNFGTIWQIFIEQICRPLELNIGLGVSETFEESKCVLSLEVCFTCEI